MNRQDGIPKHEAISDQSLQSEGSFIILGRSTSPNDISLSQVLNGPTSMNNPSTSQASLAANSFSSSTVLNDLSPDEIQNKIQAIVNENIELKDALRQNNLAMKQQFDTLVKWQEEVFKVHQSHKQKFEETKELIQKLRAENAELRKALAEFESAQLSTPSDAESVAKLQAENKSLKVKVAEAEAKDKVIRLLEFQFKTENADLKGKLQDLQKKLALAEEKGKSVNSHKHALAAVAAEREELGGGSHLGELELGKKSVSPPPPSFEMIEGAPRRTPGESGSSWVRGSDDTMRQLEEARRVLEVERQALEEDRRALEKRQRAIQVRVGEMEEQRKKAELEKERLEDRVTNLQKQLEGEKETSLELYKALEEAKKECRLESYGKWEVVSPPSEREERSPMIACESRLGLLRNYLASQEHKYIKADVWLQKMNQIIVSVMALDPVKGKEMKEEIVSLKKQLLGESDEVEQHRTYLLEAENLLAELKLSFDTLQAQAESVSTVVKENAQADYHAAQARGYRHKLDEMSARLSQAEECLGNSRSECVSLAEKLRKAELELEALPILKTQVEVYQADFNTEREERAQMASDKQRLNEEVHRLRAQNQQLLEDLENLERRVGREESRSPPDGTAANVSVNAQNPASNLMFSQIVYTPPRSKSSGSFLSGSKKRVGSGVASRSTVFNTLAAPGRGTSGSSSASTVQGGGTLPDRSTRGSSEPRQYTCPKCYRAFLEYGPLELHVNQCLDTP